MIHLKDSHSLAPQMGHFSSLVLCQTVLLLLTHSCRGQSQEVDQPQPIVAMLGDDITLPCHLEPAVDAVSMTVEWARADLTPRFVHLRREGVELLIEQNPSYIGRTSLSINKLKCGDLSLKLSKVKSSDKGIYTCLIASQGGRETQAVVSLVVGSASSPVLRLSRLSSESTAVLLDCESEGWYPEPEVSWLDGEGHVLSAGPTETVRGPDGLYSVSSRVTVEERHSNTFTCRVQQKDINQTREAQIKIPDDLFVVPSYSVGRIIIILVVGFMCVLAVVFILFISARNKNKTRMDRVDQSVEKRYSGSEQLMMEDEDKLDLALKRKNLDEKLQKNDEEQQFVQNAIKMLTEHQPELKLHKDKLVSQMLEVTDQKVKTEELKDAGKLKKDKYEKTKQGLEMKMTEYNEMVQHTKKLLETTNKMINDMTERKEKLEKENDLINTQLKRTKR